MLDLFETTGTSPPEEKPCSSCGKTKPLPDYWRDAAACDGRQSRCIECQKSNKRPRSSVAYWRKHRYGLTAADYERMLTEQSGLCAICCEPMVKPCVDHDHATGAVRGLLCNECNTGIGMLRDDLQRVLQAASYLKSHLQVQGQGTRLRPPPRVLRGRGRVRV